MHGASLADVRNFGLPIVWAVNSGQPPAEMLRMGLCPKYAADWELARRGCSLSTSLSGT